MSSVLVLAGGTSNERTVSLRSGTAVAKALQTAGYGTSIRDPRDGVENLGRADIIFPALHGEGGEDGALQVVLEEQHIRFVGSGAHASALCFDKWAYKQCLREAGLPTPKAVLVTQDTVWETALAKKPFVLKPVRGGSSIDTFIVRNPEKADRQAIAESLARYTDMLLEELISGTEVTVGILGDQALPIVEIIPPADGEFDYENKYNGKTQELCPPLHIDKTVQQQAQVLALQAHKLAGCRHLSRTDIMIANDNALFILETNTMPGLTNESLFPKMAAAQDITMSDLVDRLVRMGLQTSA